MKNEDNSKKVANFIKGNLLNLIVVLTSFAYVFMGMIVIQKAGITILECTASVVISIVCGLIIKQSLGENGFNKGYNSTIWKETKDKYCNASNLANEYIDRVDNFYAQEEIEKKRNYRRVNMVSGQMRYNWFFDKNGDYIPNPERYKTLTKHQKKVLHKCIHIKIHTLNLFSEYSLEVENDSKKEKTDKDQRTKMFGKNGFMQIATAIVGGYFSAGWKGWDLGSFIMASVSVCIWLATGIIQLYTNYNYVVIDKVNKITRKMELIVKFRRGCEQGKYLTNPYDEEPVDEKKPEVEEVVEKKVKDDFKPIKIGKEIKVYDGQKEVYT